MAERTIQDLWQMQGLPLSIKVKMTQQRIRDWVHAYGEDGVYVSFSGGKDSTVLLHLVRELYPNIRAVFVDTGLEYPEIRQFVKTFDNVEWLKPKMTFKQVIQKYGYPFISKEVAECVYGARKYLTSVMEQASLDRQTDRQTEPAYRYRFERLCGLGKYGKFSDAPSENRGGGHQDTSSNGRNSQRQEDIWEAVHRCKIGGADQQETLQTSRESERLKAALTQDSTKVIDNFRIQRLMGILPLTGKATMETIPSKGKKSAFSCERYQFFLDAPFEISQSCCGVMKKAPTKAYERKTGRHGMTAMMATESRLRTQQWLKNGCNAFDAKKPISNPMAFWTEQDVLLYILEEKIPICSVYGDVVKDAGDGVEGQLDLEDIYGKELFDLGRPLLKTTGCNRTG